MVKTNTLLRSLAGGAAGPDEILERVNRELCRDNDACMFVTLLVGMMNLESGEIALANGGHNAPVLRAADGTCAFLEFDHGPALGLYEGAEFPVWRSRLEPGQTLLLYTDGVTEAFDANEEMFSDERLLDVVPKLGLRASDATKSLLCAVHDFAGGYRQSDDITVVALQFGAEGAPAAGPGPPVEPAAPVRSPSRPLA
jgi:sigma-B regulation protein RsbU (phosphoserine phosphatase)